VASRSSLEGRLRLAELARLCDYPSRRRRRSGSGRWECQAAATRFAGETKANENNGRHFAERNESFRGKECKLLKLFIAANHAFRGIVCFQ
jgi:ribosomal protein L37AE/L43A